MHHADSVITAMSVKALTEFDFLQMEKAISYLSDINEELNRLNGDLSLLTQSAKAETARESVNIFISSVMNKPSNDRNPILVDFCQSLLTFFKNIRLSSTERRHLITSILPDFRASKERFTQMVDVARNKHQIDNFKRQMSGAGFTNITIIKPLDNEGVPVAWNIHANLGLLAGLLMSLAVQSSEIDHCLTITNSSARLSCYDQAVGYQDGAAERVVSKAIILNSATPANSQTIEKPIAKKVTVTAAQKAYDSVIANSLTMKIIKVITSKRKKVYYYTDTGRVFRKNTDRTVDFKVNDQVKIEKGFLAAQFLRNQNDTKIKVRRN